MRSTFIACRWLFAIFRTVPPVLLLCFAAPSAQAASFALPEDSVIEVRRFQFPSPSAANGPERDLPGLLHDRIVFSLQQAGFTVVSALDETGGAAPLKITPLQEPDPGETTLAEQENAAPRTAESLPDEPYPDSGMPAQTPYSPATPPEKRPSGYLLTGRVTLLKENAGAPLRIGGGARIRIEAAMHCAYQIVDVSSGKAILSDAASGSAASLVSETGDSGAMLAKLTDRAMAASAVKIASRLSGVSAESGDGGDDRAEYQDSPGKRLKPKK